MTGAPAAPNTSAARSFNCPNAIVFYNSAILSRLLEKCEAGGHEKALALVESASPVAWWHVHLGCHYPFVGGGQSIDLNAIIQGLALE